ncbi:hypothetical protein [Sphingopyxis sp. 22461]|uniref:hypothetical protein n=1 Tax=Sphingopyxis sp. 22461 TaxID=3453923 RepID=UPI003F879197
MLPDFIMHAVIQQLPKAQLDQLVRKAGFDPDNLIPPLPRELLFELTYGGEMDFNLTVGAFGEIQLLTCRVAWTADLIDDPNTGQRVAGQIQCKAHMLAPSEDGERLEWRPLDYGLISRSALDEMDARIEEQARLQELHGKSDA